MQDRPLIEHLEELRARLISIVVIIVVSFLVTFSLGDKVSEFLLGPLRTVFYDNPLIAGGKIIYIGILDKILSQFQISLWSSIILSSPLWFYQIWKFIKPALYRHEIRVVRPFILIGFILFVLGIIFGHFIVLPIIIKTFANFGVTKVEANINLKDYLVLSSKLLLLVGSLFQLPIVVLVLGLVGIVNQHSLREKRRYVYVFFAIASAIITPPDIITMLMLWGPLIFLYEIGIMAHKFIDRLISEKDDQKNSPYDC